MHVCWGRGSDYWLQVASLHFTLKRLSWLIRLAKVTEVRGIVSYLDWGEHFELHCRDGGVLGICGPGKYPSLMLNPQHEAHGHYRPFPSVPSAFMGSEDMVEESTAFVISLHQRRCIYSMNRTWDQSPIPKCAFWVIILTLILDNGLWRLIFWLLVRGSYNV